MILIISRFLLHCVQQLKNHRVYECIIVDFRSATSTEDVDIILLSCGWLIVATYYLLNNKSHWFSIQGRGGHYGELESRSRSPQSGQDLDCHTIFKAKTTITLSSNTLVVLLMSLRNVAGSFFWILFGWIAFQYIARISSGSNITLRISVGITLYLLGIWLYTWICVEPGLSN